MSDDYMSAKGTREHGTAGGPFRDEPSRMNYTDDGQGLDDGYYGGSYHDRQAAFPQAHHRGWWRSPEEEYPEYPVYTEHHDPEYPGQATLGYDPALHYSDEDNYAYDKETFSSPDIRRPQPSYSPPETISHQYTGDYFPQAEHEYYSQYRRP
ncbi:hypothetical protein SLS63_012289 [Diaporthe eres]|uniref:Uncharacterized protein n=1 Tax=Diaporthe eres TaxID=83184 RepID=A0ABR1NRM4_DIAER